MISAINRFVSKVKDCYYRHKYPQLFEDIYPRTEIIKTKEQKDLERRREQEASRCPICGTPNVSWVLGSNEVTCKKCGCDYKYYWKG